jgi:hypothetical protein
VRTAKGVGGRGPDAEKKLEGLAADIRAGHRRCMDAMKGVVEQARDIGKRLIEAKGLVRHGEWTGWVAGHCEFAMRMAQNYILVARHYKGVLAECNKADEWRLTQFLTVAQELEQKRRGKAVTPAAKASLFALPAADVARRREKLREGDAADRVRTRAVVADFLRQKLDALYAAVRQFAASKEGRGLAGEGIEPIDIGVLLVESLKAGLDPAGLVVAVPPAERPAEPPAAPERPEPPPAAPDRHLSSGRHPEPLAV